MPWAPARCRRALRALALLLALPVLLLAGPQAVADTSLSADGSSWAGPALDKWRTDVSTQGIQIDFRPIGSAAGRQQWEAGQDDFTASDVPFRSTADTGASDGDHRAGSGNAELPVYGYSYVPVTAGGTAFMYNLKLGGKQVTDLRLSPDNLVDIFTGKITYWDDPRITQEYGRALPHLQITPVVRSDGSGATAQFTRWMEHTHQQQWDAYCTAANGVTCGDYTEFFPPTGRMVSLNGSDAVANYIQQPTGLGAIGYDEYAFALTSNWPVVKVLNPAGYFSLPTASNVAVALTAAKIRGVDDNTSPSDPSYLEQDLDGVYTNPDPRSYPLSSYSYLIVPRAGAADPVPPRFNNQKGAALSQFLSYVLCAGQGAGIDAIGYSPIPRGLVRGGLLQTAHIPGNTSTVDPNTLANCPNPTFNAAGQLTILVNAPQPSPCDHQGEPLTCTVTNGQPSSGGSGSAGSAAGSGAGGSVGGAGGKPGGSGTAGAGARGGSGASAGGSGPGGAASGGATATDGSGSGNGPAAIDPQTGEQEVAQGVGGAAPATVVALDGRPQNWVLGSLTGLELVAVVAVPPFLGSWLRRRRAGAVSGGRR
ncbi:substrate-binding domain-containing protein [Kitasatospora sp. NPDC052896]|uniref:substrate-binding domain-containing protein n=1 Tax=Kitasatospora sp. NPDC052896 TaxID=3364061 RepID=UPI0037CA460C